MLEDMQGARVQNASRGLRLDNFLQRKPRALSCGQTEPLSGLPAEAEHVAPAVLEAGMAFPTGNLPRGITVDTQRR